MRIIKESVVDLELYDINFKNSSEANWTKYNIESVSINNELESCKIVASSKIKNRNLKSVVDYKDFNSNSDSVYLTLDYEVDYSIRIELFVYTDSLKINYRKIKILDLVVNNLEVVESYYSNGNRNVSIDDINKAKEFIIRHYKEEEQIRLDDPYSFKGLKLCQTDLSFKIKEF